MTPQPFPYAVNFRGFWACPCLAEWIPWFEKYLQHIGVLKAGEQLHLWQLIGDAAASGSTHHDGGAEDDACVSPAAVLASRQMGAAAWHRAYNWDGKGGMEHAHRVLNGCPHNTPARYQIAALIANFNGLGYAGHAAPDNGPRTPDVFPLRTWQQGIKWAKAQITPPTPHPKAPATTQEVTPMIDGNDESSYQSHVTPAAFHFDKASQGLKADPTYADKVKDALSRGELAGAYHYIDNSASILAQARFFVQTCGPRLGAPKAADYEQAGVTEAEQAEFVRTVQGLDTLNQVGTYESYGRYHPGQFVGDFLWVAAYDGKKEFILPNALFDQWNDKPEDEDIARFNSVADMFAWAHAKEPKGLPTRPALVLLAERNLAMQVGHRPIQSEWDRRARIANNVLRGVPNTGIPGVASTPMPVHILQAIKALHDFIVTTPASDPWGHRARIAYNALNGIH